MLPTFTCLHDMLPSVYCLPFNTRLQKQPWPLTPMLFVCSTFILINKRLSAHVNVLQPRVTLYFLIKSRVLICRFCDAMWEKGPFQPRNFAVLFVFSIWLCLCLSIICSRQGVGFNTEEFNPNPYRMFPSRTLLIKISSDLRLGCLIQIHTCNYGY